MLPGMLFTGIAIAWIPQVASDVASLWVAFACGAGLGIARTAIDALVLDGVPTTLRGTAVAVEFTVNDLWIGLGSAVLGTWQPRRIWRDVCRCRRNMRDGRRGIVCIWAETGSCLSTHGRKHGSTGASSARRHGW